MDLHKKHESDLTRQERRQLEKEKLSGMDMKHKLEYIWAYYKPQIFGVIAFFLAIWGGISWYQHAQQETILYTVVMDGYADGAAGDKLSNDFKEYLKDTDENHVAVFDTSVFSATGNSQSAYNSTVKLNTIVGAGAVDIVIAPADSVEQFTAQEAVYKLSEVLPPEFMEKYADKIIDDVCLDVSGNPLLQKQLSVAYKDARLVILNMGKHKETAAKFAAYLMEQ